MNTSWYTHTHMRAQTHAYIRHELARIACCCSHQFTCAYLWDCLHTQTFSVNAHEIRLNMILDSQFTHILTFFFLSGQPANTTLPPLPTLRLFRAAILGIAFLSSRILFAIISENQQPAFLNIFYIVLADAFSHTDKRTCSVFSLLCFHFLILAA